MGDSGARIDLVDVPLLDPWLTQSLVRECNMVPKLVFFYCLEWLYRMVSSPRRWAELELC